MYGSDCDFFLIFFFEGVGRGLRFCCRKLHSTDMYSTYMIELAPGIPGPIAGGGLPASHHRALSSHRVSTIDSASTNGISKTVTRSFPQPHRKGACLPAPRYIEAPWRT